MTQEQDIKNAIEVMRKGGVILYPTDTVWGIGCDATNAEAVKRVYDIKQRDDSKALICLVDSDARLQRYVRNVPDVAWQHPISLPTTVPSASASPTSPSLMSSASVSRRPSSLPRPTSAENLPPRTIATSIPASLRPSTMCAGHAVRSTSPTSLRASSNWAPPARSR